MRARLAIAVLGALPGFVAPHAYADHTAFDCGYDAVPVHGTDTYVGAAYGYVVSTTPGDAVSLRCYITVDGVEVASTPTATGSTATIAAGHVEYTATDLQEALLCADWGAGSEGGSVCFYTAPCGCPPQELCDLVYDATSGAVDPDLCLMG